jgi:type II secretory pathway component PulF
MRSIRTWIVVLSVVIALVVTVLIYFILPSREHLYNRLVSMGAATPAGASWFTLWKTWKKWPKD